MKVNLKNKKIKTSDLKQGQTAIIVSPGSYNNDVVMCVRGCGISKIIVEIGNSNMVLRPHIEGYKCSKDLKNVS